MTKRLIRNYIQNLKSIRDAKRGKVPNQTMTKINNVIDLYEDRKISQFTTAVNLINGLTTGNAKSKEKGNKAYQKAVEKYEDKAPITERMRNTPAKARQAKKEKAVEQKQATSFEEDKAEDGSKTDTRQSIAKNSSETGSDTRCRICFFQLNPE